MENRSLNLDGGGSGVRPYLHSPALSPDGETLAFACAGSVWLVPTRGGDARPIATGPGPNDRPRFSPDGTRLAFTSGRSGNGDIYVLDLCDGRLEQLTWHDSGDLLECWTADGRWLVFSSPRNCQAIALFRVPVSGGTPISLVADPYEAIFNADASPDGRWLAFNNNGPQWWRRGPTRHASSDIWVAPLGGSPEEFRKLNCPPGRSFWPLWDAQSSGLYFVSDRDGTENLWHLPLNGGEARPLTRFTEGRVLRPAAAPRAGVLAFERDFGLWIVETGGGEPRPVEVRAVTDAKAPPTEHRSETGGLQEFALSPDGKKVAYGVRGRLFADFADRENRPKNESFPISDIGFRESEPAWWPDSRRVAYVSDRTGEPQLFRRDLSTGEEAQLTTSPAPKHSPRASPDGRWIAFFAAPDEVRLLNAETLEEQPFIRAAHHFEPGPIRFAWSPDSRWVAYMGTDERWCSNVYAQKLGENQPIQVSFLANVSYGDLQWAPNGRFILFDTGHYRTENAIARVDLRPPAPTFRESEFAELFEEKPKPTEGEKAPDGEAPKPAEGEKPIGANGQPHDGEPANEGRPASDEKPADSEKPANGDKPANGEPAKPPEPVEIVTAGIKERMRLITSPRLNAGLQRISPDSKALVFQTSTLGKPALWSLSLEDAKRDEPAQQITSSPGWKGHVWFTGDGKRLFYVDEGRIQTREIPRGDPKPVETRAEFDISFEADKVQMFQEAWRSLRDHFYDPEYHGQDWAALRDRFRPVALGALTRADFYETLNLMVGELNASHLGAGAPGQDSRDGYLGLALDLEELAQGRFRVASVLQDGPCAVIENPVQPGEHLVAVDGTPLATDSCLDRLLLRKAGKRVMLSLSASPDGEDARTVAVRPLSTGEFDHLAYRDWVRENGRYVHGISGRRLGYVHVRAMSFECYQQLLLDLDAEAFDREGIVIDTRFNGGGHIAPFILDVLQRRRYDQSVFRTGLATSSTHLAGNRILDKPTVAITNEHSGSNTEMFSEGYRQLGLGSVVGKPTSGAVIWTWNLQLLDGGSFRLPRIQVTTLSGENQEGNARPVDVDVDRPLCQHLLGRDSQLDAAVQTLLAQIDGREANI